jgi:hypothetical protein
MCCGSKNDFCENSGGLLFCAKVQTHPGSSEIGRSLRKIQYIHPKVVETKRDLICVSQEVYYLCGVFSPNFWFPISVAASQKTQFRHSENGKSTFHWTKRKSAALAFLATPRATRVSDMALFRQTMPWSRPNLAHSDLEVMQPWTCRSFLWRDFLVNCFSQGLNFFPASRWHK